MLLCLDTFPDPACFISFENPFPEALSSTVSSAQLIVNTDSTNMAADTYAAELLHQRIHVYIKQSRRGQLPFLALKYIIQQFKHCYWLKHVTTSAPTLHIQKSTVYWEDLTLVASTIILIPMLGTHIVNTALYQKPQGDTAPIEVKSLTSFVPSFKSNDLIILSTIGVVTALEMELR